MRQVLLRNATGITKCDRTHLTRKSVRDKISDTYILRFDTKFELKPDNCLSFAKIPQILKGHEVNSEPA